MIEPIPESWAAKGRRPGTTGNVMECVECTEYKTVINAWRKAVKWIDGLDHAFAAMLACTLSTRVVGVQLWIKIIGPASCGKTTLCEAISLNKERTLAKSVIRGFHSGYKSGGDEDEEDNSLLVDVNGKTLITKDGDTLLTSPNLSQILSEARDIYDTTSRTHYRNKMGKEYTGVRMTWLLCGTSSLRSIDSSELGERFLDVVVMEDIDEEIEDEILWRVVNQEERNMCVEADGAMDKNYSPEMMQAMQLSGGYVGYLCDNAADLLSQVNMDDKQKHLCTRLGKFVAYMRARPSEKQSEVTEREFAPRLVSQLTRLTKCLAVALNKNNVDDEIMTRVTRVAMDTSRGLVLDICRYLYKSQGTGLESRNIAVEINTTEENAKKLLRFLRGLKAVTSFTTKTPRGKISAPKWKLTEGMENLYREVMG
jgi:GTPase SAR1 family protein